MLWELHRSTVLHSSLLRSVGCDSIQDFNKNSWWAISGIQRWILSWKLDSEEWKGWWKKRRNRRIIYISNYNHRQKKIKKIKNKRNKTTSPTIQKDGDKFLPSFSFHKLCSGGYFLFAELSQNACSNQCVMIMILTRSLASQSKRAQHKWALLYLNVVVICIEIKCLLNVCYWQNLISTSVTLVVLFNLFLME